MILTSKTISFPSPLDTLLPVCYYDPMTTLTNTNNTLQKVGHKHEAIMNWLLENPEAKLMECAAHFGVTQNWLSIVIHSDAFQDAFAEHREAYYAGIADGLAEKLNGLAHLCIEKLADKVEDVEDPAFLLNAADKILGRMGYGASGKAEVKVTAGDGTTVQVVSASALNQAEEARKKLQKLKDIEGEVIAKT